MLTKQSFGLFFLSVLFVASVYGTEELLLTVAYCPTAFTGAGALISVDTNTGNWSVKNTFDWPDAVQGCPLLEDPTVAYDADNHKIYFEFGDEFGLTASVDAKNGRVGSFMSKDDFFVGFENFQVGRYKLTGLMGTVTQTGYCHDGCYQVGALSTLTGRYTNITNIPFKAVLDDSHYFDESSSSYYVQASYDLRPDNEICGPEQSSECLLKIDTKAGELVSATYTNYTVYKFSQELNGDSIFGFMFGFHEMCQHPYENYLFGWVDLSTGEATPTHCIPKNTTIHEDEWISDFSSDNSLFATGSGDTETGVPQLLVFDTQTGATLVNTDLSGLAQELGTYLGEYTIWSVNFVDL